MAVVIVAAGRGNRARQDGSSGRSYRPPEDDALPKQYWPLAGLPVLRRTIAAFLAHPGIGRLTVVIHERDRAAYGAAIAGLDDPRLTAPVIGGDARQASVRAGLEALATAAPDYVLIHDGVRPFVTATTISAVIDALADSVAALPGASVVDTVKRTGKDGYVDATIPRENLWRATTPQGFRFPEILAAHRALARRGIEDATDDARVAEEAGHRVRLVAEEDGNMKLTTLADFERAERRLHADAFAACPDVRVGTGYDVHVLEPGDGVWLAGVLIPHDHRLKGHSDADAALHALTDAILGALGDGDIGRHFPPSDPQWKGAPSSLFLADAVRRVKERGGLLAHCDITIIAEAPKIGPHREAMRERIADICGISVDRIGVKATTNEGLGFAGRREGIAALATATVRLPL